MILEGMQRVLDKGAAAAQGAVSQAVVEHQPFMSGFMRLCADGWRQGWHERNGGNVTYRLTEAEVQACRAYFADDGAWTPLDVPADNLGGAHFAVTAAGSYVRNVELDLVSNVGIVQVSDAGDAWRVVWGFAGGNRPTSELSSHFMIHSVRMRATAGATRVLYHAHPEHVVALTAVMPLDARTITRALWTAMTECVIAFPRGVGVVEWMVPGGSAIARATGELMRTYDAVIWAQHGLFASGSDFDEAFGLMHTIEKAAKIHVLARAMNGGSDAFLNTIGDDDLRAIAHAFDLPLNEDFLN